MSFLFSVPFRRESPPRPSGDRDSHYDWTDFVIVIAVSERPTMPARIASDRMWPVTYRRLLGWCIQAEVLERRRLANPPSRV